ncbi:Os07g0493100, partial [Oryza sativa Japonica Group]
EARGGAGGGTIGRPWKRCRSGGRLPCLRPSSTAVPIIPSIVPTLQHQSSIIAPILAAFSASFARRGMLSTNPPMACLASLAHF